MRDLIRLDPIRSPRRRRASAAAAARVKALVLARWGGDDVVVSVHERQCPEPGCADTETVIAIFRPAVAPLRLRIAKPVAAITGADLLFLL